MENATLVSTAIHSHKHEWEKTKEEWEENPAGLLQRHREKFVLGKKLICCGQRRRRVSKVVIQTCICSQKRRITLSHDPIALCTQCRNYFYINSPSL